MGQFINTFKAYETLDDRGSHGATIGYFTTKVLGERAAKGKGWYGGDGSVVPVLMLEHEGRLYPVASDCLDGIPRDALDVDLVNKKRNDLNIAWQKIEATLTPDEIRALGLKAP